MSNLNSVVNVSIQLQTGAALGESFDYICLVGPLPAAYSQWEGSTAYSVGNVVYNGTHVYKCKTAGTSAESGGPTATSGDISDGTSENPVIWNYVQELPPDVGIYSSLTAVADAGWVTVGENADPIGLAAAVAFSQSPKPDKVYIAYQKAGDNGIENIGDTLDRAKTFGGWYVVCPAGVQESSFEDMAAWTEANTLLFGYTYVGNTDPVGPGYYRSFGYCGKTSELQQASDVPPSNFFLSVGAAVKCLSYQSGSETWAFKALGGLVPSDFSDTFIAELEAANINYYENLAGQNVTRLGKVKAGEWIDVIRFRDWLENDMRVRVATVLLSNPKIPYTDSGIALIKAAMVASLMQGQTNGGISETTVATDGSLIPGFAVSVPAAASISAADKAARVLNNCRFEAYLSGAIHLVKILGYLSYLG